MGKKSHEMMVVRAFLEKKLLKRSEIFVFSDKTFTKSGFFLKFFENFLCKIEF